MCAVAWSMFGVCQRLRAPSMRFAALRGRWVIRLLAASGSPLQALNFREAGLRQSLGELVNGPAIGGHDLVVECGDLVSVEVTKH